MTDQPADAAEAATEPSAGEKRAGLPNSEFASAPEHVKAAKVAEDTAAAAAATQAAPNPKSLSSRAFLESSVVPVLMQGAVCQPWSGSIDGLQATVIMHCRLTV